MSLYFTYEPPEPFNLFITVKAITKLNLRHIDKLEIKIFKNHVLVVHVLQTTQKLVISRCYFAEDGKEMYQEL